MSAAGRAPVVAIVGGGFSGAAVAWHLARASKAAPIRPLIHVFEPRPTLGAGLAYSTNDPAHRINVPATRMSLSPDEAPLDFSLWLDGQPDLAEDPQATLPDGRCFPARALFARYLAERMRPWLSEGTVVHHRDSVDWLGWKDGHWQIRTVHGAVQMADILVIAVSHPPPRVPALLVDALEGHPGFITNPWVPQALVTIADDARVLIVGTGLTMADTVATLERQGHHGQVLAISRRGQRSRGHPASPVQGEGDFLSAPAKTARELLGRVRSAIKAATQQGRSWHGVIDTAREQASGIWRALCADERARLVRHLRPYWDTHRFRVAPQAEAAVDRLLASGRLHIHAARLLAASAGSQGITLLLHKRHGQLWETTVDAIVTTTGPDHARVIAASPPLQALAEAGHVQPDLLQLGLLVDAESRAIGTQAGTPAPFIAGPLARGHFGELMGLPEVARHAQAVAHQVAQVAADLAEQNIKH